MERSRTTNRRGEGALLRDEILEAASRLLGDAAARQTVTLRAIAREAGIAAPSIYRHFTDRDAILDVLVDRAFGELERACEAAANASAPGVTRVRAISHAYLRFAAEHRREYRILFERSATNLAAPARPHQSGLRAFKILSDAFADLPVAGERPAPEDSLRDAQALWVALHGTVTVVPATPGFPWAPATAIVDRLVDQLTRSS